MDISTERGSLVAIVSLQESKFTLYKYEKMGKGVRLHYISSSDTLYRSAWFAGIVRAARIAGGRLVALTF